MRQAIAAIGILLIALGILGLVHPSFSYSKTEEVAKIGSLRATVKEEKNAEVPAAVSVIVLVAGIGLLVLNLRRPK